MDLDLLKIDPGTGQSVSDPQGSIFRWHWLNQPSTRILERAVELFEGYNLLLTSNGIMTEENARILCEKICRGLFFSRSIS